MPAKDTFTTHLPPVNQASYSEGLFGLQIWMSAIVILSVR